jgi:hypothetical protein
MTDKVVRYRVEDGLSYFTDQGGQLTYNSLFRPPSDVAGEQGMINDILACVNSVVREDNGPCSESSGTTPRKLVFKRKNGNSFSLVLPVRSNALEAATCVRDIFESTAFPIICIELIGEHTQNLIEELSLATKPAASAAVPIKPAAEDGKNALIFSSVMREYVSDSPFGKTLLMPFKSQTNTKDTPYIELVDFFETCTGPFTTASCAGNTSAEYRRYIPSFLTVINDLEVIQTATAPVKTNETAQIFACGQLLTQINSVVCLEYYGETNKKLHKLITPANGNI